MGKIQTFFGLAAALSLGTLATVPRAWAQQRPPLAFNLPSQGLATSLRAVGRAAGVEIIFASSDVRGLTAPALSGSFPVAQALDLLLAGSGLTTEITGATVVVRGRSEAPALSPANVANEIVVTGTRIRGGSTNSPAIVASQKAIVDAGLPTVADYIRTIPQNFSGGQNPGVGIGVAGSANFNLNAASSLNLRGLGPDATLTLLNGHRLAYGGASQAIDISAIPLAALDRIEIVPDGASAIYGSDAVGGVANVILKRDFDGVATSARLGVATDGGDQQQQYNIVAGTRWSSGGIIAAYDHERDTRITAGQRGYTQALFPTSTLLPEQRRNSATFAAHQALTPSLEFEVDGLYNHRTTGSQVAVDPATAPEIYGSTDTATTTTFALAPRLRLALGDWAVSASGVYGKDLTKYRSIFVVFGDVSDLQGCYCNETISGEAGVEGPILHLPAGDARLAVGAGYRRNRLHAYRLNTSFNFTGNQDSAFAYAELSLPLVSPDQDISFVHRLSATGALRYENYGRTGEVATPRLGFTYGPTADFEVRGSWGRSFKAPTLYQQNVPVTANLYNASSLGGTGLPSTATGVVLTNGNPALRSERAESWVASLAFHPTYLPGLRLEVSYFDIRYRNRIVAPLLFRSQALSNPVYADLVDRTPDIAAVRALLAASGSAIFNNTSRPINDASIVAVIDNRFQNVARQSLHGIDLQGDYRLDLADRRTVTLTGSAGWLRSAQQLSAGQPELTLAGRIFNPPHFRARGGVVMDTDALTASAYVNRIGGVSDTRTSNVVRINGMTTVDAAIRFGLPATTGFAEGIEFSVSVQNLLNDKPARIPTTQVYFLPYDSTNYSAIGRFINLTLSKRW